MTLDKIAWDIIHHCLPPAPKGWTRHSETYHYHDRNRVTARYERTEGRFGDWLDWEGWRNKAHNVCDIEFPDGTYRYEPDDWSIDHYKGQGFFSCRFRKLRGC